MGGATAESKSPISRVYEEDLGKDWTDQGRLERLETTSSLNICSPNNTHSYISHICHSWKSINSCLCSGVDTQRRSQTSPLKSINHIEIQPQLIGLEGFLVVDE